jgi:microcystin-dependent protein
MEPLMGQIQGFAFAWAPVGWMTCQGQLLQIAENSALFSLLGTEYGGDGRTTFGLPDLTEQSKSDGVNYCIAVMGVYPSRQ